MGSRKRWWGHSVAQTPGGHLLSWVTRDSTCWWPHWFTSSFGFLLLGLSFLPVWYDWSKIIWVGGGGREAHEGGHICVHIADSLHCPAETHHCKAIILQRTKQKTQCPTAWFKFSYGSIITVTAWSTSFKPHHELLCPQTAVWITDAHHDQSKHFLQSLSVTAHCPPLSSCTDSNTCSRVAFFSPRDTAIRRFTKVDYQKEKAGHQRPECSQ